MTDTTPEATAEDTTPTENAPLTVDTVGSVAQHLGDIQGGDRGTDPGRLAIEIGFYDPSNPDDSRYASIVVPEGIRSLSDFALAFGINAAELLGANGDNNIKPGETIRVPKSPLPFKHDVSVVTRPDYNESGASGAEITEIHDARDADVAGPTGGTLTPETPVEEPTA